MTETKKSVVALTDLFALTDLSVLISEFKPQEFFCYIFNELNEMNLDEYEKFSTIFHSKFIEMINQTDIKTSNINALLTNALIKKSAMDANVLMDKFIGNVDEMESMIETDKKKIKKLKVAIEIAKETGCDHKELSAKFEELFGKTQGDYKLSKSIILKKLLLVDLKEIIKCINLDPKAVIGHINYMDSFSNIGKFVNKVHDLIIINDGFIHEYTAEEKNILSENKKEYLKVIDTVNIIDDEEDDE